jgi:ribonuclease P protein component
MSRPLSERHHKRETLCRAERLTLKKKIDALMKDGHAIKAAGMTMIYAQMELPTPFAAQVMFSASKRNYKRAHDRNRIKRLMREGYRKQKHIVYSFLEGYPIQCAVLFIFTGKQLPDQAYVHGKIFGLLKRFTESFTPVLDKTLQPNEPTNES